VTPEECSPGARWSVPAGWPPSDVGKGPCWYAFRAALDCAGQLSEVVLKVAADSKYDLFVNGRLLVREGGLKRGPVPCGTYYDTIGIPADLLTNGKNQLAVLLTYFGRAGFSHRDSGTPGLWVAASGGRLGPWKSIEHPAYFDAGYVRDAYRLPESSVGYDARRELEGWTTAEFDDSAWPEAVPAGVPGCLPWGELEERPVPLWYWSEEQAYMSEEELDDGKTDGWRRILCRLPSNRHLLPVLECEARAGLRVSVTAQHDTSCLSPVYLTRAGYQHHVFPGWINAEAVVYHLPVSLKVTRLGYLETAYPAKNAGGFACDDDLLNGLWLKARQTLRVTMRDNFMDCPCRERAQWPGDLVVQLGQVPYCLDGAAELLVRKALLETFRWQRPDGVLYGPVPEGNWKVELPAQMLSVLSRFGVWTYYLNTGDLETVRTIYPLAVRYLEVWRLQNDGTIAYRPEPRNAEPQFVDGVEHGIWDWIDWGRRIDAEPALNAWYALAVEGVALMAAALGEEAAARERLEQLAEVRAAIQAAYWDPSAGAYHSADFTGLPDDRVQALMVLGGIATSENYPQVKRALLGTEQASPYMEKYVLEACFALGCAAEGLDRMRRRYRRLTENADSTLWERWPEMADHPGTINHSWSGGPLTLLSSVVAGIRPLEAGWRQILVRPDPGSLQRLDCTVQVPQGLCHLDLRRDGDQWIVALAVPAGCSVRFDPGALSPGGEVREVAAGADPVRFTVPAVG
jgi:alpha-L-rhamnosidase